MPSGCQVAEPYDPSEPPGAFLLESDGEMEGNSKEMTDSDDKALLSPLRPIDSIALR